MITIDCKDVLSIKNELLVYVSDEGSHDDYSRVHKFDSNGNFVKTWNMDSGGSTGSPRQYGLAVDNEGNLFAVDTRNAIINKYTSEGELITNWGAYGDGGRQTPRR